MYIVVGHKYIVFWCRPSSTRLSADISWNRLRTRRRIDLKLSQVFRNHYDPRKCIVFGTRPSSACPSVWARFGTRRPILRILVGIFGNFGPLPRFGFCWVSKSVFGCISYNETELDLAQLSGFAESANLCLDLNLVVCQFQWDTKHVELYSRYK